MNSHLDHECGDSTAVEPTYRGTCFCGAVEIAANGEPVEMGYCHCQSCRSYSGAPVTAFALWRDSQVSVSAGEHFLAGFQKSPMSDRRFCSRCGGHVLTYHPGFGFTDVHAGVLPSLNFHPSIHLNYAETVLQIRDGLPKLKDFPSTVGGSGLLLPE